jgi:hypothetical protein
LEALLKDVESRTFLNELLVIERREDLYPYVDLQYLTTEPGSTGLLLAEGSLPVAADLVAHPSGLTLATMSDEVSTWPTADQRALAAFLHSDRTIRFLDGALQSVIERKRELALHGSFVTRYQAGLWIAGLHPLQTGDADDLGAPKPALRIVPAPSDVPDERSHAHAFDPP